MQETFDWLYEKSQNKETKGIDLYGLIISEQNILLAYRNIKSNTGSKTSGVDKLTINDYKIKDQESFIKEIRETLENYQPQMVRRVEIPKPNGKMRPLGIPTMRDRLIQQMFKQILEPICEARFHKHSYGFRPNRSAHHAIARCNFMIGIVGNHYAVDLDIKSFFDNVNHTRLMKQLWNIGVKDKRVLAIIYKMLRAPIKGKGVPTKGTPQGGILSPLLANVVLNDLDWWISNQWETFDSKKTYSTKSIQVAELKKTNLKEMYIVRYADDLKIFARTSESARRVYHATKGYIEDRLKLEISNEKSKVTNLRKRKSEFLGFEMKAVLKRKKYVSNTFVSKKNKERIKQEIRKKVKEIQKHPNPQTVGEYNSFILGVRNYYEVASHVSVDFSKISYQTSKTKRVRLIKNAKYGRPKRKTTLYRKCFKGNSKTYTISGVPMFPLEDTKWVLPKFFNPKINNYTEEGRKLIRERQSGHIQNEISKMIKSFNRKRSVEYNDNRISKYSMQRGKCAITQWFLTAEEIHCHHIISLLLGGTDKFQNLIIVHKDVHTLIHASREETINELLGKLNLTNKQIEKVNELRKKCNLEEISIQVN